MRQKLKVQSSKFKVQSRKKLQGSKSIFPIMCVMSVLCGSVFLKAQSLPVAQPQAVGMNAVRLKLIDAEVEKAIAEKKLPGAVVLIGRKGKIVYRKAFGNRSLVPQPEKMTVDTIFDVASLTKPIATATSVMILTEQGKLRLNDPVSRYIPEIQDKDAQKITIQQLLTHTSGYAPDFDLREKWAGQKGMLEALEKEKLRQPPGTRFVYSDIGFIVLGEIVKRAGGKTLDLYAYQNFTVPLKMLNSRFFGVWEESQSLLNMMSRSEVAPTENIKNQQSYLGGKLEGDDITSERILRGQVHDPTAFRMGGVAGHAGLFSTGDDLARYCQMILNGGILDGKRIMSASTVARMIAPVVVLETGATRGLGWDMNTGFSANRGELFPLGSFGHTGFTGTSVWIDPVSQTFVVFLSNRVHPDGKGDVTPLRAKVATIAASAIEDTPVEAVRLAESVYASQVAAQTPAFRERLRSSQIENLLRLQPIPPAQTQTRLNAEVLNGIDVLEKNNFKELEGLRVGLITNHTGRNRAGRQTVDVLKEAGKLKLVALFSPEHGIRGQLDQENIVDSADEKTGLPVYSLYGATRKPKPEQLQNLDALVFDIQDIGTRFYTYISTLGGVLEEAAKAGKPVFVLDRPNPINGVEVEGALADADKLSFVAYHTLPVRHGMTIGELARMFNEERKFNADLRVVKMQNWRRAMWFDQTNQTWVNPSPNMRSLAQATLYPGVGLLEFTNVSVGRGTDAPFESVGAPWIDGRKLAAHLNARQIPGVRFVPVGFKPAASIFAGEECGGINIIVTSREAFKPVLTGIEIAAALRIIYPADWQVENYAKLLLNRQIFETVRGGADAREIQKAWQPQLEEFIKRRARFLLYD